MPNPLARLIDQRVGPCFEFGGYRFARAETDGERRAVYQLRHEVYAEEGFIRAEEFPSGEFQDAYDAVSVQILVRDAGGAPVGTTRFVLPSELGFPTERFFDFEPPEVARDRLGEYGRLAIRDGHRGGTRAPMLGMLKAVFEVMVEHRITHVFAFLPPKLAASYAALGCVSVPLRTLPPREETLARRRPMRDYFARQPVAPVLFDLGQMLREMGASPDRREAGYAWGRGPGVEPIGPRAPGGVPKPGR
ncbi:MAG: GNAT family N-acetyltransferase [Deltaproteobacteria bacterium]|nr:GNAT family N-acetyltransferase [Deltaproteobacteria bacterium]